MSTSRARATLFRGHRVAVTREGDGRDELANLLRKAGAIAEDWSVLKTVDPADSDAFEEAAAHADRFTWIAFTSVRAVTRVVARVPTCPVGVRVAAVGASTSNALKHAGWPVTLCPERAGADALADALAPLVEGDDIIWFPSSVQALDVLPRRLEDAGAMVFVTPVYDVASVPLDRAACLEQARTLDAITFCSPSAVRALDDAIGADALRTVPAACLGTRTALAAHDAGFTNVIVAETPTLTALVGALAVRCGALPPRAELDRAAPC